MQSKNYSLIGGFSDESATCLVRTILVTTGLFLVLKSVCFDGFITYPALLTGIDELAAITEIEGEAIGLEFSTTDVLCNFNKTAKQYIIDRTKQSLRIKTTIVTGNETDMVMNVLNAKNTSRLKVLNPSDGSNGAINTLQQWDKEKTDNATLYTLSMALLHSVGWMEGQLIKHQMI